MPRPKSRSDSGKSELSKAVRELRERLGLSQQAFSNALGVALNTIARYETSREPSGEALVKLGNLARANELWDFYFIFYVHYLDVVLNDFPIGVVEIPGNPQRKLSPRGYLVLKPHGLNELRIAHILSVLYYRAIRDDENLSKRVHDLILEVDRWAVEEMGMGEAVEPIFLSDLPRTGVEPIIGIPAEFRFITYRDEPKTKTRKEKK